MRTFRKFQALAVVLAAALGLVEAANTFLPKASVKQSWTDSINVGGFAGKGDADWSTDVSLVLPWVHTARFWKTELSYQPSLETFSKTDTLDNTGHQLLFRGTRVSGLKSQLRLSAVYVRTQPPPSLAAKLDPEDITQTEFYFLTNHTEVEALRLSLDYRRVLNARLSWEFGLSAANSSASQISSNDPDEGYVDPLEDKRSYRGSFGLKHAFTAADSVGFGYSYSQFVPDNSGDTELHELEASYVHSQGQRYAFGLQAGAYSQSHEGDRASSRFTGGTHLTRTSRRSSLQLALNQAFTSGGNLEGTAENVEGVISTFLGLGSHWRWSTQGYYGINRPQNASTGKRTIYSGGSGIAWSPPGRVDVQLNVAYQDRTYEDPEGNVQAGSGNFTVASVTAAWRIPGYGSEPGR